MASLFYIHCNRSIYKSNSFPISLQRSLVVLDHPAPPKPFRHRGHPRHGGLYHPHQRLREEGRDGEGVELRLRASRERPWQQHIGVFENEVPGIPKIKWLIAVDSGLSMLNVDGYLFLFKSCSKYHFEAHQFFHTPTLPAGQRFTLSSQGCSAP